MSDAPREWRFYLDDMIAFSGKVLAYTTGLDQASFVANELIYDATLRNLELIGEAATHIPDKGTQRPSRNSVADDHRHPQQAHSRLSRRR
jgi:uncharacterized protein with HEPN domain